MCADHGSQAVGGVSGGWGQRNGVGGWGMGGVCGLGRSCWCDMLDFEYIHYQKVNDIKTIIDVITYPATV